MALALTCGVSSAYAQQRTKTMINDGWKFSFGHAASFEKNFMTGTRYFNYLTKTGYGDGPTAKSFDDRPWRNVDLPHDWAVEVPFSGSASHSHGCKQVGWKFPETSIGWYRKTIVIPQSDYGKKISVLFDGIFRNSEVWVNGFYLGGEPSGYLDSQYDITDYIDYGNENVITVKADATLEEGWFYEGAGIYRDVWLIKTDPVHIQKDGIFVSSEVSDARNAEITARVKVDNDGLAKKNVSVKITLKNPKGDILATKDLPSSSILAVDGHEFVTRLNVSGIDLWSPENPNLYDVEVSVLADGSQVDCQNIKHGFRTIKFTGDKGFFLNGKQYKIIGSNIHQDFAGVGCAVTKPLQIERVKMLKKYGFNAIRTSHNPVNVDLLDICDSLGMVLLEETRLEGINDYHKSQLRRMIYRDRNHPCIIAWSIGNEEWQIESNIYGERITRTLQAYAKTLDSTRMYTAAVSGGCGYGTSEALELMGFNYLAQCDIDNYKTKHMDQPGWLTEETSGCGTRGCYITDSSKCHMVQMDRAGGTSIERGYKFCLEREWMGGLFYWTGFDYRGEPTPFSFPAIGSQFGILDLCGFPKDQAFYILANNSDAPMVHIFPHWNFKGHEGETIDLWAYTNCDEVELLLNKKSLGRQKLEKYGHLSWKVKYAPGTLTAKGYRAGKMVVTQEVKTSGEASQLVLQSNKQTYKAGTDDIILVSVSAKDAKGIEVPDADSKIDFEISGNGKIIGVGNGDPSSLENDKEFAPSFGLQISNMKEMTVKSLSSWKQEMESAKASDWRNALVNDRNDRWDNYHDTLLVIKGEFSVSDIHDGDEFSLYSKSILYTQDIYINGQLIAKDIKRDAPQSYKLDNSLIKKGKNEVIFVGKKIKKAYEWDEPNTDPGVVGQSMKESQYSRRLFNGKALVIIKADKLGTGAITLTAKSSGLKSASVTIN